MSFDGSALPPPILAVAPNGARRTNTDHPALPMTADEIARTAAECREAGAAMIRLHVRDRNGDHSLDADLYRDAICAFGPLDTACAVADAVFGGHAGVGFENSLNLPVAKRAGSSAGL